MNEPYPIKHFIAKEEWCPICNKFHPRYIEPCVLDEHKEFLQKVEEELEENLRSTGRTTRLIDYYIQELFNHPFDTIEIIDHTNNQQSNVHLTQMILKRMYEEHRKNKIKVIKQNVLKYVQL